MFSWWFPATARGKNPGVRKLINPRPILNDLPHRAIGSNVYAFKSVIVGVGRVRSSDHHVRTLDHQNLGVYRSPAEYSGHHSSATFSAQVEFSPPVEVALLMVLNLASLAGTNPQVMSNSVLVAAHASAPFVRLPYSRHVLPWLLGDHACW